MPLYYDNAFYEECRLCIWEITETLEELLETSHINENELKEVEKKTVKRQLEWITIRLLLKQLLKTDEKILLDYDEYGKPHLNGIKKHISISHTKQFVAVIVHNKKKVGIDIEITAPRIEKIKHKFLSEKENEWTKGNDSLEKLFIIWGAKESAFKIYAEGGIEFRKMLEVNPFDYTEKGETFVTINKNIITCAYPVWWERLGELMMVYAVEN
ncbi:MAG: 4'-phosphopantetheinyl transferase superfamily protein [Bacteroidia bacterium]